MRIDSSNVNLTSTHVLFQQRNVEEKLLSWVGNRRPADVDANRSNRPALSSQDVVSISQRAAARARQFKVHINTAPPDQSKGKDPKDFLSDKDKLKIELAEILLEKATGKKIKIKVLNANDMKASPAANDAAQRMAAAQQGAQASPAPERVGWGVEYDYHESYHEYESMTFSAEATVMTSDGQAIKIDIDLNMTREFASETNVSVRLGDALRKDPLVINFDGTAAELTDTKFSFDIDSDGAEDQISFVGQNSGFLAVDNNGDGVINDGSELFGPTTGDGFAELAAYDSDGNNWIDEADAIFNNLRIWTKDAEGTDQLLALGASNVGAIYLGNISTQFELKNVNNESLGEIQSSSIYVGENGGAGTVQHIDLTV